jgi:signal transduction histidine kinase
MNRVSKAKTEAMSKGSIIAILALTLLVFIGGDIESVYISALFGLRLVIILRLPVRYYLPAALLETALVSINPGYGIYSHVDTIAYQAHLIGIATTYLSAWFLVRDVRSSAGERPAIFPRYVLFIGAVSAATITAMLAFEHLSNPRDFFYLISAAYAKLAIYSLSAVVFGFFAVYVIEYPGYKRGSVAMALTMPILLFLLYRAGTWAFEILNNISFIYLALLLVIGGLAVTAYRFGVLTTWVGCFSAVLIISSQHNGWTLNTWNGAISYLIFLCIFNLYIAFFINRLNQAQERLVESKRREELLIRSMQDIVHSQNVVITERMDQVVRDLHDEVGQGLVAASIYIRSLENSLESVNAKRAFEKGSAMLESTSISIRNMLNSLDRQPMNYAYLSQELASGRIAQLLHGSGVGYHFTITPESPAWSEVPPGIYAYIHRFFQESVTNILRHSRADQCWIDLRLRIRTDQILITGSIRDNDTQRDFNFNKTGSTGLDGLVQKTRQAGGILRHGRKPAFKKIGFLLQVPRR